MGVRQGAARPDLEAAAGTLGRCWCGVTDSESLGSDYVRCGECGTVLYRFDPDQTEYAEGDIGFYDDRYWQRHVPQVLGLPGLEERARSDLAERAVFHLMKILDHQAPAGRLLELGCGAGSLTYLLCQAGFDADGLELGPAAIEFARDHFGIEVHGGPLEAQGDLGPWDAIVAVDVLEHLPDPLGTMVLCARQLGAGGRLFLQTPCYRQEGADWEMLLPQEHLHLFTEASVERLLRAAGFEAVEVERSLFPYDMWVTASPRSPLVKRREPLVGLPPLVAALIDAYTESTRLSDERNAIDADRRRKQEDVDQQRQELESVREDQSAKADLIARVTSELESARADQSAKEELIARVTSELKSVRADQVAKEELIVRVTSELESVRAEQVAKEELIARVTSELESVRADQRAKAGLIDRLSLELESVRDDQQAKEIVIRRLAQNLEEAGAELTEIRAELEAIQADRRYRLLQAIGIRLGGRR